MTAPEPRPRRVLAIHPRFLTFAVTILHIVATLLVLYELDLQHYQTAKKLLVTENFDDYLTLPTESLKELAMEALHSPHPRGRTRALSELHNTVDLLLRDPNIPVFRFVLRDPNGQALLDRSDPQKPARLETWNNRLFLSGFSGFVDMRLPRSLATVPGQPVPVGRLQAYYGSPVSKTAVTDLTNHHRTYAAVILLASGLFYGVLYRTLLRPMETVSLRLEESRSTPPRLIPRPTSLLESGFNHMALQALLQQLDQILEPLLKPGLPAQEVLPTIDAALEFIRETFPAEAVVIAHMSPAGTEPQIQDLHLLPTLGELPDHLRQALIQAHQHPGETHAQPGDSHIWTSLPLAQQLLAAVVILPPTPADPDLARTAASAAARALLRPIAAAAALHQELFRQSREANIVLSRNLGHDLTNIIATAKLDLAVLRRLLDENPAALTERKKNLIRTSVSALLDTTRFLQEVVNIYRAFSFLKRPIREPALVQDMLQTFVAAFRPSVSARVDIRLEVPDTPIHAHVETRLLKLALFNLVQNALDALKRLPAEALPDSPTVWLRLTPDGPSPEIPGFCIEILDNGPGLRDAQGQLLPPAAIPSIFGFGYSTKDRDVNEGLGLAWVRTIIEEFHGGVIEAANREPQGAQFILRIPGKPGPDPSHPEHNAPPEATGAAGAGLPTTP
jgi:signal transduction histidine kinase